MNTLEEQASAYIGALRGNDRENAYHRLLELGPDVVPFVSRSFKQETDPSIRSTLLSIAWRTNSSDALPLLKGALDDGEPPVWKEALDGLIVLRGPTALEILRQARTGAKADKAEWIDEAIEQITEAAG